MKRIKFLNTVSKLFHWKATPTRAFNEFMYEFLGIFLISENSLKFANFFAEVTNSRSMPESQSQNYSKAAALPLRMSLVIDLIFIKV